MRKASDVPAWLKRRPITIAEARAAGISKCQLRGGHWRHVARGVYAWAELEDDPNERAAAILRLLPASCVASGPTAARFHGLDLDLSDRIEVTVPRDASVDGGRDVVVKRACLSQEDICELRGVTLTSPLRTWFDLARHLRRADAVAAVDWALHRRKIARNDLERYRDEHPRVAGLVQARDVLQLAEEASESLMESRLRMVLLSSGLPRPSVQYPVGGRRIDLYYPQARLGIEYDGEVHRASVADDNRRQNWLLSKGITLLRFTAVDVYKTPDATAAQVRARLDAARLSGQATR